MYFVYAEIECVVTRTLSLAVQTKFVCLCRYVDNYKVEGEFMDLDLLDHLGDAMLLNERLMFLGIVVLLIHHIYMCVSVC